MVCSAVAPASEAATSSETGLPETGAPANTAGLLALALGLLGAGFVLVRPRRRYTRHLSHL